MQTQRYTMMDDGSVRVTTSVRVASDVRDLPRIGITLHLDGSLEHLAWYGRGPIDTYSDRKASATVDVYRSTVAEQYVPYIMPQEHGHKTDVRWLRLTDAQGSGIEITADALFEFNASHFTDADLTAAMHTTDLVPRQEIILNLDHRMRGLGTGLFVDTLPEYQLNEAEYEFSFYIKGLVADQDQRPTTTGAGRRRAMKGG